jgi:thiol-disulfide isomerase/thioredoxin
MKFALAAVCVATIAVSLARADDPQKDADILLREGSGERRAAKDALEGKAPPALKVQNWINTEGKELKLSDLKGKVVVLDFWGVWCGPCRAAMPHLKEIYAKHKDAGLEVIGVHTTNAGDRMAAYVEESQLPWPVALDIEGQTVDAFAVDSFPDYYLIDRAGNLRVADLQNAQVDAAIELLLKETP